MKAKQDLNEVLGTASRLPFVAGRVSCWQATARHLRVGFTVPARWPAIVQIHHSSSSVTSPVRLHLAPRPPRAQHVLLGAGSPATAEACKSQFPCRGLVDGGWISGWLGGWISSLKSVSFIYNAPCPLGSLWFMVNRPVRWGEGTPKILFWRMTKYLFTFSLTCSISFFFSLSLLQTLSLSCNLFHAFNRLHCHLHLDFYQLKKMGSAYLGTQP